MKSIILAAGYGRRMRPLTDRVHKALLPVGETTILSRIVEGLASIGVTEHVVVTGYRADDVRAYLAERHPGTEFQFVHNARFDETNNIVSLSLALDAMPLDEDVVLVECDLLFDPAILEALVAPGVENVALVDRWRPGMDGTVVSVEGGVVTHVYPPHLQGEQFRFDDKFKTLNIYRFGHAFCRRVLQPLLSCYANLIDGNVFYELVLGMLVNMQRERIGAAVVDGRKWAEVDDPNDLASARFTFEPNARLPVLDRAAGGHWNFDVLDFHFIRNMHFPTDAMIAAMRQALPALVRNYGSRQEVLDEKLGYFLQVPASRVRTLAGASQLFPMLPALLGAKRVACPAPTFGEYARMWPERVTYRDDGTVSTAEIEQVSATADLVVFVTPNNPTGTTLSTDWIHAYAQRNPTKRVLVDESFVEFADEEPMVARLEREPLPNVLVVRSLGKSLGVPGLRLGFAYSHDSELIRRIGEQLPIWSLSAPGEHFLELLLKHRTDLAASLARTKADRADLAQRLAEVPGVERVITGGANFVLIRLAGAEPAFGARVTNALLARHGIYVKDVSNRHPDPGPWLRLAVRLPAEHQRLCDALADVLASPAVRG